MFRPPTRKRADTTAGLATMPFRFSRPRHAGDDAVRDMNPSVLWHAFVAVRTCCAGDGHIPT
ncbi:hypothetical protein AA0521_1198 [Komagataeibacter intermedius NRIC 0521]|uniref:Uncharacterized protein n=1 Tax=Komagataeibacter intermedius NRIC 0521 TaxID=1307934 RepID=A0ABQ0PGX2_9PROT|nr:hypothetical protein AA0521_1198 [Komagataeibacter intermedius NRIC 0521]